MRNVSELREMSVDELNDELLSLRKEQFGLRMKKANGTLDKTDHINKVRKSVARVKTILTEKAGNNNVK